MDTNILRAKLIKVFEKWINDADEKELQNIKRTIEKTIDGWYDVQKLIVRKIN